MAVTTFDSLDELRGATGRHLGTSDWVEVTRAQVDQFVAATGANGYEDDVPDHLTLALTNLLLPWVVEVRNVSMGVNYGTGAIRFPSPAPVGSRMRMGVELTAVDDIAGGVQTTMLLTVDVEGRHAPACVVESLSRWLV